MEHPTPQLNRVMQTLSIKSDAMIAFKETFVRVTKVDMTVGDFAKKLKSRFPSLEISQNHEMWKKCNDCGDWFDLRKFDRCESCGSKNF